MNEDLKYRSKFNKIPAENVGSFSYENNTYASNPELQRLGELARRQAEPAKPDQAIDSSAIDYIKSLDEQLENEHLTPEEVITRASQGVANLRLDYEANYAKYLKEFERAA